MAVKLIKGLAYLLAGAGLVWAAGLPVWASYLVGCWCGGNAMGYLVSWAVEKVTAAREVEQAKARILSFVARKGGTHGTTTH